MNPTSQKTAIVTGGNAGLGFECAKKLALEGWHVVLACRNETTAREASHLPRSATNSPTIFVEKLDLASLASVRTFSQTIATKLERKELPPLRALVNNAGFQMGALTEYTAEGYEMTFGVNHLGQFLLTHLISPYLTAQARVIFVASDVHDPKSKLVMPFPNPSYTRAEQFAAGVMETMNGVKMGQQRYSTSKLCNVLATYSLAEYFAQQGREITVTAFNPGMMLGIALARKFDVFSRFAWKYILPALQLINTNVRTTEISGRDLAMLASNPRFDGITAAYFSGTKAIPSSQDSYDTIKQIDLWHTSQSLCGLEATPLPVRIR